MEMALRTSRGKYMFSSITNASTGVEKKKFEFPGADLLRKVGLMVDF